LQLLTKTQKFNAQNDKNSQKGTFRSKTDELHHISLSKPVSAFSLVMLQFDETVGFGVSGNQIQVVRDGT
jgi:hypothetical protein